MRVEKNILIYLISMFKGRDRVNNITPAKLPGDSDGVSG